MPTKNPLLGRLNFLSEIEKVVNLRSASLVNFREKYLGICSETLKVENFQGEYFSSYQTVILNFWTFEKHAKLKILA